jgi:hypothetical protein
MVAGFIYCKIYRYQAFFKKRMCTGPDTKHRNTFIHGLDYMGGWNVKGFGGGGLWEEASRDMDEQQFCHSPKATEGKGSICKREDLQ